MRFLPDLSGVRRVINRIREIEEMFTPHVDSKLLVNKPKDVRFSSVLQEERKKIEHRDIGSLIKEYSDKYGVDPLLVTAIARVESGFNPKAVSPKGAVGIMQLMPSTARAFGVKNLYSVDENIEGGIKYLKFLSDKYQGDMNKVLAAYNAGTGAVDRYGGVPPYAETRDYVSKVKEMYERLMKGE